MSLIYNLDFKEGKGMTTKESVRGNRLNIDYVFNKARYKGSCPPKRVKSEIQGYALDFDGYSTSTKDEPLELKGSFTVSVLLAPRCFEACHGDVSTTIIDQLDKTTKKGFAVSLYRHGEVQLEIGDGEQIYQLRTEQPLELFKKTLITATYSCEKQVAIIYINSEIQIMSNLFEGFKQGEIPLSIGLNNTPFKIGNHFIGGMFSGLMEFIQIYDEALSREWIQSEFNAISGKLNLDFKEMDLDETKLLDDIHRPQFHAIPPQHWMNEPHAPFYYNGKYHLFYQKNAVGPYFSNLHWGHWTSEDLVFWKNEKTALFPQKGELSPSGVWSGSAAIGKNGIPTLFYTFANFTNKFNQGVAIARPKNLEDIHLVDWEMAPHAAIIQTADQGMPSQFRDPFVWKDPYEERWYLIIGGGIEDKGPTAWIYISDDCENWEFKGEFFTADAKVHPHLGTNWELPVFLPVSDHKGNSKYVYIFMSYFATESPYHADTYYYLGEFDKENHKFIPDTQEPQLMDYGRFKFSGPSGFVDPVTNKSIVFSILQGDRSEPEEYASGWAHNAGLPLEVYMENNELRMKPLENLVALREEILVDETDKSLNEVNMKLESIQGKMLEILVEFEETEKIIGIDLKKNPMNQEKARLTYDKNKKYVCIDRSESRLGSKGDVQGGVLDIDNGLMMHIYIDHSAIECYLNNKKMMTTRAYPTLENSDYLSLIGEKDIRIKSIKIYRLKSIW